MECPCFPEKCMSPCIFFGPAFKWCVNINALTHTGFLGLLNVCLILGMHLFCLREQRIMEISISWPLSHTRSLDNLKKTKLQTNKIWWNNNTPYSAWSIQASLTSGWVSLPSSWARGGFRKWVPTKQSTHQNRGYSQYCCCNGLHGNFQGSHHF